MAHIARPLLERFEAKYTPEPNSGCWLWTAAHTGHMQYGCIGMGGASRKMRSAHRVSYELFVGAIPEGMLVCHRCDQPSCVNPDHLFLGTLQDNALDAVRKGRMLPPHVRRLQNRSA